MSMAAQRCAEAGIPFEIVYKRDGNGQCLTIDAWLAANGTVPVMGGGPHVCSLQFKGEVLQRWAARRWPGEVVTWLIGIEANEGHRTRRFTAPKGELNRLSYPLVDRGMDRRDCEAVLAPACVQVFVCVLSVHEPWRDHRVG